ncbi:cytosolic protein [Deferribacter autotrophicus]|uniref:Cytosolic protein n=1 Tax=Deferribacter autotrophicus TaxID=500465 RepID=A0A5A8F3E8_9BACT|nr:PmeII family type II restriction endonuclease [Deferribacter autotrophicus]KAA0257504.1 cytosolic protein [Deferribacter autotrophicus]
MSLLDEIRVYVAENIGKFHGKKLARLRKLKLKEILRKKNPYLFKVKNFESASEIVKGIVDAFISSQEETMFGDWLEDLAIFVCYKVYGGMKSTALGIDLEFVRDGKRYLVSIKSGPNWGNSSQIKKMEQDFKNAKIRLRGRVNEEIVCVNGCCYGRVTVDKGGYLKICGQDFWELISGEPNLYIDIIEPLGYQAREKNEEYLVEYNAKLNLFTNEFIEIFCFKDGRIDWERLVNFNSGSRRG